jgi:long-chain acyl-CoA synthetase
MVNGYLRTGDVATIDEEGYVFIVDRIKDMILCGGYNVYPRHVEDAVYKHPAIAECVCAGLPDEVRGEIVKIWITLKEGASLTPDELKVFLKQYLSPIEMPKFIEIRDTPLPKTLIGKLSRKALLEEEAAK